MPPAPVPRQFQSFTLLVPLEHRIFAQEIAARRFISLSDFFREALSEKLAREKRDEAVAHAR